MQTQFPDNTTGHAPGNEPDNSSRRDFIRTSAIAAAGIAVAGVNAQSYARIIGANDRVRVGLVGFSARAKDALIPSFNVYGKEMNMEIAAVSDIWKLRREEGVAFVTEKTGLAPAPARNNDELYAMKDIDAVIISTADFQHAYHAIEAVKAGRDAYCEKPMANRMEDARAMLKAVNESGKIVQIGTQRRSSPNYIKANEYLRTGAFGPINMAEMSWNVNQPGRWRRPRLVADLREADTDWNRFLVNRPKEAWDPRKYLEYRLFWPYSSGIPDQWMVHQIDTVHWFTDLPHPRSVVVNGGIYNWPDGRKNWDTLTAVFDYGPFNDLSKGFQVLYQSRMGNSAGGIKEHYYSIGGALNLDKNTVSDEGGMEKWAADEMNMKQIKLESMSLPEVKLSTAANAGVDAGTLAHVINWMDCLRSRKAPNADVRAGYNHSIALCMTIAAMHSGKKAIFDEKKQEVQTI
ncbi:MAG: Gfo/Idh/MocA family oxidoreductase [Bacteroidota bacterium]